MTEFTVHSRHDTATTSKVETKGGKTVDAVQKIAIVELVSEGIPSRTLHVPIGDEDEIEAAEIFQVGNVVREGAYTLVKEA